MDIWIKDSETKPKSQTEKVFFARMCITTKLLSFIKDVAGDLVFSFSELCHILCDQINVLHSI